MSRLVPNAKQLEVVDHPLGDFLVVAPPGCGKTEALGLRLAAHVQRGDVKLPRKALGITFSNRARSNLAGRVRGSLGQDWREVVSVTNFHGLASRLIGAHGQRVGVDDSVGMPSRAWLRKTERRAGFTNSNRDRVSEVLRLAKTGGPSDEEVAERLQQSGEPVAIEYERLRVEDNRLDYNDLIRLAVRLLRDDAVRQLYVEHFGAIVVDEVQDLTSDQLSMVVALGPRKTTFAGDESQAIYRFAGADAARTFRTVRALPDLAHAELDVSYRSSPKVLAVTNVLSNAVGGPTLRAAFADKWSGGGETALLTAGDWAEEAQKILRHASLILGANSTRSIGIIARRSSRLTRVRRAFRNSGLPTQDWTAATDVPEVARLIHRCFAQLGARQKTEQERLDELRARCVAAADRLDVDTCEWLDDALWNLERRVQDGESLATVIRETRLTQDPDLPVGPGVHLLTGHTGKGQEFDWAFVLGLEEGHVPDFRAATEDSLADERRVLLVMASRARHGLVFTFSASSESSSGPWATTRSRWLAAAEPHLHFRW